MTHAQTTNHPTSCLLPLLQLLLTPGLLPLSWWPSQPSPAGTLQAKQGPPSYLPACPGAGRRGQAGRQAQAAAPPTEDQRRAAAAAAAELLA